MHEKSIESRVVAELNAVFGSKVDNLSKSNELVEKYVKQLIDIEEKLSDSPILNSAFVGANHSIEDADEKLQNLDAYVEKIDSKISGFKEINDNISSNLEKIHELEHLIEYYRVLQDVQDISNELTSCIHSKEEQKIVNLFLSLCGCPTSTDSVIGRLKDVDAPHMKLYARRMALYWHDIIKDKLSSEFETLLKSIKWPNLGHLLHESFNPSRDVLNKLQSLAEYLFLVQLPGYDRFMYVKLSPSIICPPFSTPIELLVAPFRIRFEYHFMGNRQTNRPDKPEYYFTQIINWARDNHHFVSEVFQAPSTRACVSDNIRLEFIRGLVQLTIEKLLQDIEEISFDEQLFAHLIDEILSFEQDLKATLSYPNSLPSAVSVLTQPVFFVKWLSIEEKFTQDKMDILLSDDNMPWEMLDPFGFTNITSPLTAASANARDEHELAELKIPKCADQFVRLLEAMKERYCILPQPTHQLQFLALQTELVDNFRRRLVQLHNTSVSTLNILNAIFYISSVLREWGENVHYLHLHAALLGPNAEEITSVFDKSLNELDHWQNKLVKQLSSKVVDEIKAKSMAYRHDNWVSMPKQNPNEAFVLSYSAGEMFQLLVSTLHNLEEALSTKIFNAVLRRVAKKLDDFFVDSMIMNTKFSEGGAAQFKFDVGRNLLPLFGQYSRRPGVLFRNLSDSYILLSLPFGTALLLHQTLKPAYKTTNTEELATMKEALKEVGILSLPITLAVDVLERRNDVFT